VEVREGPGLSRDGGDHLLREDIERLLRDPQMVQLPLPDGPDERGCFYQFLAFGDDDSPFRGAGQEVTGAANPLEGRSDVAG